MEKRLPHNRKLKKILIFCIQTTIFRGIPFMPRISHICGVFYYSVQAVRSFILLLQFILAFNIGTINLCLWNITKRLPNLMKNCQFSPFHIYTWDYLSTSLCPGFFSQTTLWFQNVEIQFNIQMKTNKKALWLFFVISSYFHIERSMQHFMLKA